MARKQSLDGIEGVLVTRIRALTSDEQIIQDRLDLLRYDVSKKAQHERMELLHELSSVMGSIAEIGNLLVLEFGWYEDDRGNFRSPR